MNQITRRSWWIVLAAAILLRVIFFGVSVTCVSPTADEALAVLEAKSIRHGQFQLLFFAQPYLFPVDSYLMAPLVELVPRNAFGARYLAAIFWGASVAGSLAICWRLVGPRRAWPGMLLVLFPPAYVLMHQAGTALPGYWGIATFSWLLVELALKVQSSRDTSAALPVLAGLLAGLAFSYHPISLAVAAGSVAVICLGRDARSAIRNTLRLAAGAAVGLMPFLLAWRWYGSPPAVSESRPLGEVLPTLFHPVISGALEQAIAFSPPKFPDGKPPLASPLAALDPILLFLVFVLLAVVTIQRLAAFARRLTCVSKWPTLVVEDIFPAAVLLNLIFFAASWRPHDPRFLLPLAWALPFLVVSLCARLSTRVYRVVAAACCVIALLNVITSVAVMRQWLSPTFSREIGNSDLSPVIQYLREVGISNCYSTYWDTYRIDFQTDEKIVCSQFVNERFPGFPLPYKDTVDASKNVAYVLTPSGWYKPAWFETDLARMDVVYQRAERGDFAVYHDLKCLPCLHEVLVDYEQWDIERSQPPEVALHLIDPKGWWQSESLQAKGMSVTLRLRAPVPLVRVSLDYRSTDDAHRPRGLRLSAHTASGWITISSHDHQAFAHGFVNGRPDYSGHFRETHRFPAVEADAVRIEITKPNPRSPWILDGIELFKATDSLELSQFADPKSPALVERRLRLLSEREHENNRPLLELRRLYRSLGDTEKLAEVERLEVARFRPQVRLDWQFGPDLKLLGYDLGTLGVRRFEITYYWKAMRATSNDYAAYLHLRGAGTRFQDDYFPGAPHTTRFWEPDQIVEEKRTIVVPETAPNGVYVAELGVWVPESQRHVRLGPWGWWGARRRTLLALEVEGDRVVVRAEP